MEGKYNALPKISKEFEDMLFEYAEEHQRRGLTVASPQKKKGKDTSTLLQLTAAKKESEDTREVEE